MFLILCLVMSSGLIYATGAADLNDDGDQGKCTQIYFGKGVTDSGAYFHARTEDYSSRYAKLFTVIPAADHEPGDLYWSSDPDSVNFSWPYPAHSLRYTTLREPIRQYDGTVYLDYEPWIEATTNEKGVSVSATVTLSGNKTAIRNADRYGGTTAIGEADIPSVIAMQATTAREGCELIAQVIDKVGANGAEGFMVSDPNEVWYFQILAGHEYVAVKCPDDMVGLSPNLTANVVTSSTYDYIDITDTANVIASPRLVSLPKSLDALVSDPNDPDPDNPTTIKIADTYTSATSNHQTQGRLRNGYGYLWGLTTQAEINAKFPVASKYVDFFVEPRANYKYSLYEAMRMLGSRGEGTAWETANPSSNSVCIGNNNTVEAHVFEVRPWMPAELATIKWVCMGPAEFGIYLPYYGSLITDVFGKYYCYEDQVAYNLADPDDNTFFWVFREIHNRCNVTNLADRERIGNGVRAFWETYEKSLIEQQALVDKYMADVLKNQGMAAAELAATEISMKLAEDTYEYAKQILAELIAFRTANTPGNFVPSFSAIPAYAPDTLVFLNLDADVVSYISGDVEFTLSVSNAKDVLAVELEFEVDGSSLSGKGYVGLNDFTAMNGILWTYAGDGKWKGTATLALPSETTTGLTSEAPVDIGKFFYAAKGYGNAAMTVTSARVVGLYGDTTRYLIPVIENGTATTVVARSKYDLNRDGVVDALDLGIMLLYCGFDADSPNWGALVKVNDAWGNGVTASMCDVNDDGLIDMLDLLDLFIHYTK